MAIFVCVCVCSGLRVWVCVLISHMQSSRAFCMHRPYILCTPYTIYLFIFVVFLLLLLFLYVLPFLCGSLLHSQSCSVLYSRSYCCCHCLIAVSVCTDELRHAVSTERQITIHTRMAVRWCRCHCWCIEYLSARKEAKLKCMERCIVRLCPYVQSSASLYVCVCVCVCAYLCVHVRWWYFLLEFTPAIKHIHIHI